MQAHKLLVISFACGAQTHIIPAFAVWTTFSAMGIDMLFNLTTAPSIENLVARDTTPLACAIQGSQEIWAIGEGFRG